MSKTQNTTIQETMLEQLNYSKVNGFPFFAYTGIKRFAMLGEDCLILHLPRNPKRLTNVNIIYDYGWDVYKVQTFKNGVMVDKLDEVYFDELAQKIAGFMGVL